MYIHPLSLPLLLPLLPLSLAALPTSPTYHLKTRSLSPTRLHNNLYLQSYHTGAGLNDAVFVPKPSPAKLAQDPNYISTGFLNATQQEFDLGNQFPYGFYMGGDTNYAGWEPVHVDVGPGDSGFYFNNTDGSGRRGLKWNSAEFVEWLGESR